MEIPTMALLSANQQSPEILFWVGCAGSFDQRAQKITKAFATILNKTGINTPYLAKRKYAPEILHAEQVMSFCSR